jgi:hypothetical protein
MFTKFGAALAVLLATSAFAGRADARECHQQRRIEQGVRSGELNPREARRLEARETHLDREVARDRALNGGTLTPREKVKVERQQNRVSRSIYRQKHDLRWGGRGARHRRRSRSVGAPPPRQRGASSTVRTRFSSASGRIGLPSSSVSRSSTPWWTIAPSV